MASKLGNSTDYDQNPISSEGSQPVKFRHVKFQAISFMRFQENARKTQMEVVRIHQHALFQAMRSHENASKPLWVDGWTESELDHQSSG